MRMYVNGVGDFEIKDVVVVERNCVGEGGVECYRIETRVREFVRRRFLVD